jgi:hypothetical protein
MIEVVLAVVTLNFLLCIFVAIRSLLSGDFIQKRCMEMMEAFARRDGAYPQVNAAEPGKAYRVRPDGLIEDGSGILMNQQGFVVDPDTLEPIEKYHG